MKPWLVEHQNILSQQYSQQNLPHAILMSGVTGAGKLSLAKWLIQVLACQNPIQSTEHQALSSCGQCKTCLLNISNTYPDHLNLVAEKTSIGVDEIRSANIFLQKTAQIGHYKTVLIEQSESMTVAAANALLKTLEEPTDNSIIVLITDDIDRLLPTIISRSRVLNIRPVVGSSLVKNLTDNNSGYSGENFDERFINLTQLPELTSADINKDFQYFKECYLTYIYQQQGEDILIKQLLTHEYSLRWLEQITVNLQREKLLSTSSDMTNSLSNHTLNLIYKLIINGCKILTSYTQANKELFCEQLIIKIGDTIKQSKSLT